MNAKKDAEPCVFFCLTDGAAAGEADERTKYTYERALTPDKAHITVIISQL